MTVLFFIFVIFSLKCYVLLTFSLNTRYSHLFKLLIIILTLTFIIEKLIIFFFEVIKKVTHC